MKIVLDTNVIVSALLTPSGLSARILQFSFGKVLKILYDNRIMAEYIDVLHRDKFKIDKKPAEFIINFINKNGEFVNAAHQIAKFPDETDKKFYEVYKSGKAQYLITGNLKHFPKEKGIVSPKQFIENYCQQPDSKVKKAQSGRRKK